MENDVKKISDVFDTIWGAIIVAYSAWVLLFMKYDTYPASDTGIRSQQYYFLWAALSIIYLVFFPIFIKIFYYRTLPEKVLKWFCLVALVFGCTFITWYGFFKNPFNYTASMIGLYYPWHFKMWGMFASLSLFVNVLYMYRKNNYNGTAGIICASLGTGAIFVTINIPSAGEELILNSLQCMAHWAGALLFAFLFAAAIILFLIHEVRKHNKKYLILTIVFAAILALMLVLLVTVGKDGIIESLPMWAAYLLLFLVNFTNIFESKNKAPKDEVIYVREPKNIV